MHASFIGYSYSCNALNSYARRIHVLLMLFLEAVGQYLVGYNEAFNKTFQSANICWRKGAIKATDVLVHLPALVDPGLLDFIFARLDGLVGGQPTKKYFFINCIKGCMEFFIIYSLG